MRFTIASTSIVAVLALSASRAMAQVAGDPVTYTQGNVVYTAVLDPDLDTVSDRPYSTITTTGAATTIAPATTAVATTAAAQAAGGAALGGGGGIPTTQTGLQTISGYNPPGNTAVPSPNNFSSGSVLVPSQIPGYTGKENSQGVTGAGVRLQADTLVLGGLFGAGLFALF